MGKRGRKRTCKGKRRFHDKAEATRMLHRIQSRPAHHGHNGDRPVRAYHCPGCNGWHLTHKADRG